ncbi:MAG: periplasmic heavy metal sensor [Firmicutes bacterium]|nr:periplasmic heavy metal sensor [Bacillota bacterium]
MRKKFSILVVSLFLFLTTALTVTAGYRGLGDGPNPNYRFIGRQKAWTGRRLGLELTPDQQEKMLQLRQKLERETLELRHRLQQLNLELRHLWKAEQPDQNAINQKLTEMIPLRIELHSKSQQAREALESILTPEQLEKWKSSQPNFPGRGRRFRHKPVMK